MTSPEGGGPVTRCHGQNYVEHPVVHTVHTGPRTGSALSGTPCTCGAGSTRPGPRWTPACGPSTSRRRPPWPGGGWTPGGTRPRPGQPPVIGTLELDSCLVDHVLSFTESHVPRFGHGQCAVGGRLYVFGGRAGTAIDEQLMSDLHCWDPATAAWSPVVARGGAPPCPRSFHSMVAPPGGSCFYVFGGCPQQGRLADLHR